MNKTKQNKPFLAWWHKYSAIRKSPEFMEFIVTVNKNSIFKDPIKFTLIHFL